MAEILNNRYHLLKPLGSGGCGQTFLAEDEYTFNSKCVVKQFKPSTTDPSSYQIIQERFQREAAILKKIGENNHQIPTLYAYLIQNQEFYLVQEWIEGFNLKQKVERDGVFSEAEVRKFLSDILPVLTYIHARGIIHRDIKPENVLIRVTDGKPVLIDFGAVKEIATTIVNNQGAAATSIVIGSPGYMPLEQSAGQPMFASDIYSLGLTAIYLLTGQSPQDMRDLRTGNFAWREFAGGISDELADVLNKATQQMPGNRYQAADEMLSAIAANPQPPPQESKEKSQSSKEGEATRIFATLAPLKSVLPLLAAALVILGVSLLLFNLKSIVNTFTALAPPAPPEPVAPVCKGDLNQNVLEKIMAREYLVMGVQWYSPPMNYSPEDENFKPGEEKEDERRGKELSWERTGFDYEMAVMIASAMGLRGNKTVRAREVSEFEDLFCLLNRKERDGKFSVDVIMSGIAKDPKYDSTISWSRGYVEFGYALIAKKSSDIEKLDDCKNKRIGIVKGDNIVRDYVKDKLPNARTVELSDEENGWTNNAINKDNVVDAIIYDFPFAVAELKAINEEKLESGIKGQTLQIIDATLPDSRRTYNIGVARGNDELLEQINEAIEKVKKTPRYADLVREYMSPLPGTVKKPSEVVGAREYIVKAGDSLSKIALAQLNDGRRWPEIDKLNNIGNEYLIFPGQKIFLPEQ